MKPILFNTEMVRAILDGRKSVTRRAVKPQLPTTACVRKLHRGRVCDWIFWVDNEKVHTMKMPYRPGNILYVRETWNYGYCDTTDFEYRYNETFFEELPHGSKKGTFLMPRYFYRTEDLDGIVGMKWCPSIHMPKEAARLFLRVTDVRVERLQDITDDEILAEGIRSKKPEWVRIDFADLWNATIKKADLPRYGWAANPWVFVISFERISKEEALRMEMGK